MRARLMPLRCRVRPHRSGGDARGDWGLDRERRRQARSTQGQRKADLARMVFVAGRSIVVEGRMLALGVKRAQPSQRRRLTGRRRDLVSGGMPGMSVAVMMRKSGRELERQGYQPQHRTPSAPPVLHHAHYWML